MPHSYNTRSTTHSSTTSPTSSPNSSPASFLPPTPPPSRTNDALPLLSSATLLAEAAKRAQMAYVVHAETGAESTAVSSDTAVQTDRRMGTTTHTAIDGLLAEI
ncbi:hypothetical protein VE02_05721 [Pseudogymnoascus sp. 03VT05]|nr:hypothetical protein VE02_05721 [Pseudogymnoascus sp. 03VT05]